MECKDRIIKCWRKKFIFEGFEEGAKGKVCQLLRAFYGLKQVLCTWYSQIDAYLAAQGLKKSTTHYNMYYSIKDDKCMIIFFYVDDLLLRGDNEEEIIELKGIFRRIRDDSP